MTRFFKKNPENASFEECDISDSAEFIEIYWNWIGLAIPMVLGLEDALTRYNDRFKMNDNTCSVIQPSTWLALFEHNAKYCSSDEAKLLSSASLAIRPPC